MKKSLFPETGTFYRTCLHTHSTMSDGVLTPEEVKAFYQSMGYSVVAFTDHDLLTPETQLTDAHFVALTAIELEPIADRKKEKLVHLNLLSKHPDTYVTRCFNFNAFTPGNPVDDRALARIPKEQKELDLMPMGTSTETLNAIIAQAKKEGFIVTLNHPSWSDLIYPEYIGLKGLWGVEVFNSGDLYTGTPESFQPVYDLWNEGEPVMPVAADDMHRPVQGGRGWMMVHAPELTYDAIIHALENGDCYATTGPEIISISLEGTILTVETKEKAAAITVRFKKRPGCKNGCDTNHFEADLTKYLTLPEYRDGWISVYVRDDQNREAWTRFYSVRELLA